MREANVWAAKYKAQVVAKYKAQEVSAAVQDMELTCSQAAADRRYLSTLTCEEHIAQCVRDVNGAFDQLMCERTKAGERQAQEASEQAKYTVTAPKPKLLRKTTDIFDTSPSASSSAAGPSVSQVQNSKQETKQAKDTAVKKKRNIDGQPAESLHGRKKKRAAKEAGQDSKEDTKATIKYLFELQKEERRQKKAEKQ